EVLAAQAPADTPPPTSSAGEPPATSEAARATPPPPAGAAPTRPREYQILEKGGGGGMGAVYRAPPTRPGRVVALKVLSPHGLHDDAAVARFRREMKAVGKLDHPNIVRATDAGEVDGVHFLVMEFVAGETLARLVQTHRRLRVADA